MNKLIEFFKAKAFQTAITSISVCLVVVVSAGAIVHSNNKKLEAALNELSSSTTENITESSSETTTESTTENTTAISTTEKKKDVTTTTEPAGDKTIQYLAEYERITQEYERKRAELEELTQLYVSYTLRPFDGTHDEYESYSIAEKEMNEYNSKVAERNAEAEKTKEKISQLDDEYKKDIEELKKMYGIIK